MVEARSTCSDADLLAFGDGNLWVGRSNESTISEIDPKINQVVRTLKLRDLGRLRDHRRRLGVGHASPRTTRVWQFDENGSFERTYDVGHFPRMSAWFGGGLWVGV